MIKLEKKTFFSKCYFIFILILISNYFRLDDFFFSKLSNSIRRIRQQLVIQRDQLGTKTFLERYNGKLRPLKITDANGNLIEQYYYQDEKLLKVETLNITNGSKLLLKVRWISDSGLIATAFADLNKDGVISSEEQVAERMASIENNTRTILLSHTTLKKEQFRHQGIGLTMANWIIRYSNFLFGIEKVTNIGSQNPIIVTIMKKLIQAQSLEYGVYPEFDFGEIHSRTVGNVSDLELLKEIGSFDIGAADNDGFGKAAFKVIISGNKVRFSQWDLLPIGTDISRLKLLQKPSKWLISLDGIIIGQVKRFNQFVKVRGLINPIGIYFDKEGQIHQYNILKQA